MRCVVVTGYEGAGVVGVRSDRLDGVADVGRILEHRCHSLVSLAYRLLRVSLCGDGIWSGSGSVSGNGDAANAAGLLGADAPRGVFPFRVRLNTGPATTVVKIVVTTRAVNTSVPNTPQRTPTIAITIWITPRVFSPAPIAVDSLQLNPLSLAPKPAPANFDATATPHMTMVDTATGMVRSIDRLSCSPIAAKKIGLKKAITIT